MWTNTTIWLLNSSPWNNLPYSGFHRPDASGHFPRWTTIDDLSIRRVWCSWGLPVLCRVSVYEQAVWILSTPQITHGGAVSALCSFPVWKALFWTRFCVDQPFQFSPVYKPKERNCWEMQPDFLTLWGAAALSPNTTIYNDDFSASLLVLITDHPFLSLSLWCWFKKGSQAGLKLSVLSRITLIYNITSRPSASASWVL